MSAPARTLGLVLALAALVAPAAALAHPHEGPEADSLRARMHSGALRGYPSPAAAGWISVGATAGPMLAVLVAPNNATGPAAVAGVLVGPAFGYIYGGIGTKSVPGIA